QNPREVRSVQPIRPAVIRQQIEAVVEELPPDAIKTGMLYSAGVITEVAACLQRLKCPVIVDPVMVATSGALLLQRNAIAVLKKKLLPLATLVTPNLDEAVLLTGLPLKTENDLQTA